MSTALLPARLMAGAAAPLVPIVRATAATPLDSPTPCAEWDLAALVRHLIFWSPFLAAAGRRTAPVPVAEHEHAVRLDGWPDALDAARADVVAAWSEPSAWAGTTSMGSPEQLPAPVLGGMVLGELVVHGWDLARAVGERPEWAPEVLTATLEAVSGLVERGRGMGIFGPEVGLPPGASLLDRTVAVTGRNPAWVP